VSEPDCVACSNARTHRLSGIYQTGCMGCDARALSNSPIFYVAARAQVLTPEYREALRKVFPSLPTAEAHARVTEWVR
jgi:hypothetical protein